MSEISELRAIQKEQLHIRKEIYETKGILKATFGKKWSIKLESIELLRNTRELGKEIGLLRKQMARMLEGFDREKSIEGISIIIKSEVAERVANAETPAVEKTKKYTWVPMFHYEKNIGAGNGASSDSGLSARDKFTVSFVDKATTGIAGIALGNLASSATLASSAASALSLSFAPLAPVVGLVVSELTKVYLEHQEKLENLGSIMEQQSLNIETMFRSINPEIGDERAKIESEIFMRLVRDNSANTGFDQNDVMTAGGMVAANINNIGIEEVMGYVRFAEDIAALNHGSTATETMNALMEAKNGNMGAIQRYLPGVNLSEYKPEEFEGKVMSMLMKLYKGGVEKRLQTAEGKLARNEMIKLKNMQDEASKVNESKKSQYDSAFKEMNMSTDERIERLNAGGFTGIGSIKQSISQGQGRVITLPKSQEKAADTQNSLGGGFAGIGSIKQSIMHGHGEPMTLSKPEKKESDIQKSIYFRNGMPETTTIKGPQLTFNINGANLTPDDIYNKVAVPLKMAIANMSSQSNSNARFGGALA